ncbi:MAG: SDR family oxidoreductase [Actinomycetota bacterium]
MDLGLTDKRVLITGGSRGIGKAIVAAFLDEGARVATCARGAESLLEMAGELGSHGELHHHTCDMAEPDAVRALVEWAVERLGGLDVVVSNVSAMNARDFEVGYEVDIRGMATLIDAALPHLEHHAGANVIAIGSRAGSAGTILPAYSAYKAATASYMKSLGIRHAKRGIRFNCISPGDILFEGGTWAAARDDNPRFFEAILAENPMQRLGAPEEIADVVAFVASERASFMTGANVLVDGGATGGIQL